MFKENKIIRIYFFSFFLFLAYNKSAFAICSINADLSCVDSRPNGHPTYEDILWTQRTPYERAVLFASKGVQSSEVGCSQFASIIKTECGILDPVQYSFRENINSESINGYIMTHDSNLSEDTNNIEDVKLYFKTNLNVSVDTQLEKAVKSILSVDQINQILNFIKPTSIQSTLSLKIACQAGQKGSLNSLGCRYSYSCEKSSDGQTNFVIDKKPAISANYLCTSNNSVNLIYGAINKNSLESNTASLKYTTDFVSFEKMQMVAVNTENLSTLLEKKWKQKSTNWSILQLPAAFVMMSNSLTSPYSALMENVIDDLKSDVHLIPILVSKPDYSKIAPVDIVEHPKSGKYFEGETVTLKVKATGDALKYQWYYMVDLSSQKIHKLSTKGLGPELTFNFSDANNAGYYYVEVTNPLGKIQKSAYAEIKLKYAEPKVDAPIIITQPVGANYKKYDHIKLDVVATGGSLLYDWYKDGKLIENRLKTDSKLELIIEDNSGPIRKNCSVAYDCTGGGEFYVKVYNQKGEVFSNKIKVTCTGCYGDSPPFSIASKPVQLKRAKGSTVELKVETTGGSNLSYQWSKDGKIINGATKSTYQFKLTEYGYFTVKVSKGDYVETAEIASVYIISEPSISVHPYSNNFKDGETVDLKVRAFGSGPFSYQWYRGETPISGATNDTYQFTFKDQVAGSYKVKVSNEGGFVFSNVANIGKIVNPPTIVSHPISVNKKSGESVTLSVTASGSRNLTYQWYYWFKNKEGKSDRREISGANSASYTFTMASDKAGEYNVRVSNAGGETNSATADVKLIEAPRITAQPLSVSKAASESVSLSVSASSNGSLIYQWYKGNSPINGANQSVYYFIMASDKAGDYKVKVSNSAGEVYSSVAKITLLTAPIITVHPVSASKKSGDLVSLGVTATGTVAYQWYKNSIPISGETKSNYQFKMTLDKADSYQVKVTNENGATYSNIAKILLITPPAIYKQPVSVIKKSGEDVSLSVEANSNNGNLTYQWYKDNTPITGVNSSVFQFKMATNKVGEYRVKVANEAGDVQSNTISVSLFNDLQIKTHPVSSAKKSGESVSLSVVATSSNRNLVYQWYKGSSAISGATGDTYRFTMSSDKAGDYYVKVSHTDGFVISSHATVTLLAVPTITTQPISVNESVMGLVTLNVVATGSGNLSYQWYKGTTAISGATSSTLSFNLKSDQVGDYKVKVLNSVGEVFSNVAKVNLIARPTVTTNPTSALKKVGDSVTLSVVASGSGVLEYQWMRGNTNVVGATTSTYTFTMSTDKTGEYSVRVKNIAGEVVSAAATVALLTAPSITVHPSSAQKKAGESVTLNVTANSSGSLNYQWYKGTTAISGATSSNYTLTMSSDKVGDYRVKVSNAAGEVQSNIASLTIITAPSITVHPASISKASNQTVNLSVTASGSGTLNYQWYQGSTAISGATGSSYSFKMEAAKAGNYKVKVSNLAGETESNLAAITLATVPSITTHPVSLIKKSGDAVSLRVVATASGGLNYQWYRGSELIADAKSANHSFTMSKDKIGEYWVKVSNEAGETRSNVATVNFEGAPVITKQLTMTLTGHLSTLGEYQQWYTYNTGFDMEIEARGSNIKYQWYKDGQPYGKESSTANYKSFTVVEVNGQPRLSSFGTYQVKVTNDSGAVYSNEIHIDLPELRIDFGTSNRKRAGERVNLEGISNGTIELKDCYWTFNGQKIQGANSKKYNFTFESSKAGTYRINCTNVFGFPISAQQWLGEN